MSRIAALFCCRGGEGRRDQSIDRLYLILRFMGGQILVLQIRRSESDDIDGECQIWVGDERGRSQGAIRVQQGRTGRRLNPNDTCSALPFPWAARSSSQADIGPKMPITGTGPTKYRREASPL
jgi:hypothetical protein